jgi:lipopolysaccharide export system protein LptA
MQSINWQYLLQTSRGLLFCLCIISQPVMALKSDRQKPLQVNANSTEGMLGDGITTLRGNVDIHQGTLHITADEAEVNKVDGRVKSVTFRGQPAFLEQEIEEQGLVQATANTIDYQVASGIVTLTGNADVTHPQYRISGDLLTYDLNIQHFQGNGDETGNGRIHIQLDPEVVNSGTESNKAGSDNKQKNTDVTDSSTDEQAAEKLDPDNARTDNH